MKETLHEFPIVAILWEDHITFERESIPKRIELTPTLTVGVLLKRTKKYLLIGYNLETYADRDEVDFIIIVSSAVVSMREYGKIQLKKLRTKEAS